MSDSVQEIKDKLTIEEVVGSYVELHKAGKHFKGKSPFTSENTPSFYVSPDRGVYYCFSSNQGGDMFSFIQAMEGVDFKGALTILAEKAGVELVREDPQKRTERDNQYAILEAYTAWLQSNLDTAPEVKKYIIDRGVTEKTSQLWRIGFAPDEWRSGREQLLAKKYNDNQLRKAGLVKGDAGKDPYDVFRNRVMFPLSDASGRIVAFSGRTLSSDKDTPKYVNSPETELYKKSELLYGYDKARQGIRKFDFSLIVEGQFDVVLCHQAGYNNTIAVSGTALTVQHVTLLQRLSNRVVLALDADRAGLSAVKRAADIMLAKGMDIKVARMPEGSDPADIIKDDPHKFKDIIGHSVTVIEHLLDVLKKTARDDRAFLLEVREEVLPRIARMPSALEQEHFVGKVAERLGSSKDGVMSELQRVKAVLAEQASKAESKSAEPIYQSVAAQVAPDIQSRISGLTSYFAVLVTLGSEVEKDIIEKIFTDSTGLQPELVLEAMPAPERAKLTFMIEKQFAEVIDKVRLQEIVDKLNQLRKMYLQKTLIEMRAQVQQFEAAGAADELESAMVKIQDLQQKMAQPPFDISIFLGE